MNGNSRCSTACRSGHPDGLVWSGGAGAHAVVEWADLKQVQQCSDVVLATIQAFCA